MKVVDSAVNDLDGCFGVGQVDAIDRGTERITRRPKPVDVDVEQGQFGTFAVERGSDLGADSTRRAGDQCTSTDESTMLAPHGDGV